MPGSPLKSSERKTTAVVQAPAAIPRRSQLSQSSRRHLRMLPRLLNDQHRIVHDDTQHDGGKAQGHDAQFPHDESAKAQRQHHAQRH